jgi:hypothetical protein
MQVKKKLAVAVTAMSIAALGGATAASAAQAQDEMLSATTTTFTGTWGGWCFKGSSSATFSSSGSASDPYAGSFTETNANVKVSVTYTSRTLTLSIPFTIKSGGTTITGTVTNPAPYSGGSLLCFGGSFYTGGPIVNATAAAYTATIKSAGITQNVNGTADVSAAFDFRPFHVLGTAPTVTLLNFP